MKDELSASQRKAKANSNRGGVHDHANCQNKVNPQVHRTGNYNSLQGNVQYPSRLTDHPQCLLRQKTLKRGKEKVAKKITIEKIAILL